MPSDVPTINENLFYNSLKEIENNHYIIGKTFDDGYYILGLPNFIPIFQNINYKENVFEQTCNSIKKYNGQLKILDEIIYDVDTIEDLESLNLTNIQYSIIIPTLNEEENIVMTLDSIITNAKSLNHLEIIIVDGGSIDHTIKKIIEYKHKIQFNNIYIYEIYSLGRSFQMNFGFTKSKGKYVMFLHVDTNDSKNSCWLRLLEFIVNKIRKLPYGDQVMCFSAGNFHGFEYVSLLEDVRLLKLYKNDKRINLQSSIETIYKELIYHKNQNLCCLINDIVMRTINGDVILDIGSNVGIFSILLSNELKRSNKTAEIICFEPSDTIFKYLRKNIKLYYHITGNIFTYKYAVSNTNKTSLLYDDGESSHIVDNDTIKIECVSFDTLFNLEKRISIIKIDCECHELIALQGMIKTINAFNPIIYIEILNNASTLLFYNKTSLFGEIKTFLMI
ncbi:hypothetical protein I4U23_022268 [Adineta vaga]|nr:hypothetical protein I4U23_022268 [Adineta vaga]